MTKDKQRTLVKKSLEEYKTRLRNTIVKANTNPNSFEAKHRELLVKKYNQQIRVLNLRLTKILN